MSRFSPQFLDELRGRTLLSALIGRSVKLTRAGREWKACCPFHHEKSPSFYVNDDKGFYHCFGCSAHGDAIRWMTDQRGLAFVDAVKELADAAGLALPAPDPRAAERDERASKQHDVMAAAAEWFAEQLHNEAGTDARVYLNKRGIAPATVETFGIGFAPDTRDGLKKALTRFGDPQLIEAGLLINVEDKTPYDRFRGRLMIPIRDPRGRVIAFGGRILGVGEPKYLNSPDTPLFDKGRTLYNLDRAAPVARKAGRLIVVEGYMDVIALAQAGIAEVVAPLGTALTEAQLERLWRVVDVPVLCLDGDGPGRKAAVRAAERALPLLESPKSLHFVTLPEGQDPDDLVRSGGAVALLQLLALPEKLVDFIWRSSNEERALDTPEARAGLRHHLDDLAAVIPDKMLASEFKESFKSLFFKTFRFSNFRSKLRPDELSAIRTAMGNTYAKRRRSIDDTIMRAIMFGLSRYTEVLHEDLEAVCQLEIADTYLAAWRSALVSAAVEHPDLDEDLVDTILAQSDVSPVEKRNIHKDLKFSFFLKGNEYARRDLREVISVCIVERETREALARAKGRFMASLDAQTWDEQRELELQALSLAERRRDWAASLEVAA